MVYRRQSEIIKTHDLNKLINICSQWDEDIVSLKPIAHTLRPFDTEFRYPTEHEIPDKQETLDAINQAEKIFNFVKTKINTFEKEKEFTSTQKRIDE